MVLPMYLVDDQINQVALLSVSPHSGDGCEGSPLGRALFQVFQVEDTAGKRADKVQGSWCLHDRGTRQTNKRGNFR